MRFSDDRAVLSRKTLDSKYTGDIYVNDARTRRGKVDGLRVIGRNSPVRLYKAVSDGNGGFQRDKSGNVILGDFIREVV